MRCWTTVRIPRGIRRDGADHPLTQVDMVLVGSIRHLRSSSSSGVLSSCLVLATWYCCTGSIGILPCSIFCRIILIIIIIVVVVLLISIISIIIIICLGIIEI